MTATPPPQLSPLSDPHRRLRVQVVAHRGASARAPENTLSAVRAGIACGADGVEIDVRRSRDGEFVVLHDPTLRRTTDVGVRRWRRSDPRVDQFTLAKLQRLDAGSWKGPSFVGERIPTLEAVMNHVASSQVHLLVEIKRPVGSDRRDLTELAAVLRDTALPHHRVTIQSFNRQAMRGLRELLPSVSLGILCRSTPADLAALSTWADQVGVHHKGLDQRAVDQVKGWGMRCVTWTVNQPGAMRRAIALGVDGIITDHPDVLTSLVNGLPPHGLTSEGDQHPLPARPSTNRLTRAHAISVRCSASTLGSEADMRLRGADNLPLQVRSMRITPTDPTTEPTDPPVEPPVETPALSVDTEGVTTVIPGRAKGRRGQCCRSCARRVAQVARRVMLLLGGEEIVTRNVDLSAGTGRDLRVIMPRAAGDELRAGRPVTLEVQTGSASPICTSSRSGRPSRSR